MASPPQRVYLQSLDERGCGIQVEFHWRGDRYSHTICRVAGDTAIPLYSSLEGAEDELFPASPCLVELHQQKHILFLTGATSTCHWSLSIRAMPASKLVFEVACRLRVPPPWLGSTYNILHPSAQESLRSNSELTQSSQQIRILALAESPLKLPTTLQWNYTARA